MVLSGEEHAVCPVSKPKTQKTHITYIIWNQQVIFRDIYVDTSSYMDVIKISEKKEAMQLKESIEA